MKKITLIVLGLIISTFSFGQQILSHSVDGTTVDNGGVACADQGNGTSSDNIFSRSYTPSDFGFTGDFFVMGARFIPVFTDAGGGEAVYTVRFSTSDAAYPDGTLTTIGETTLIVNIDNDGLEQEVLIDTPAMVDASTEVIVEIDIPDSADLFDARIGVNAAGQNDPSYIFSNACSLTSPTDFAAINFPDNHLILDLIGDDSLSVNDDLITENIAIFPNPTNGDLNMNFSRSLGTINVAVVNVNGQKVLTTTMEGIGNNTLSTSRLANGVYFAQISSVEGSATIKFIKN